jgi:predicted ATPase
VKLEKLHISNFKSLVNVEIDQPNPFTVFVGPNGSGKSNIFEALEFLNYYYKSSKSELMNLFGGPAILHINNREAIDTEAIKQYESGRQNILLDDDANFNEIVVSVNTLNQKFRLKAGFGATIYFSTPEIKLDKSSTADFNLFIQGFNRLFIGNQKLRKYNTLSNIALNIDASNLENVLKRIFENQNSSKEALIEHLQILIPEFENIEIQTSSLSGQNELAIYEKTLTKPLTKNLISDGTYNILALLTALYQSNEPQFLCIEEPENGLHPFAIKQLVKLFRQQCEEKGHYIWLNTHSQTLVSELRPEEIITVNKEDGETKIRQHKGENIYNLTMDEAWLSNALGGGMPW